MSIESRSRQYGKVFDHWQIKEFLGKGSGGQTAVFRLTRSDTTRGTSALKIINLVEERGSFEELSSFRKSEYEDACKECSRKAEQEVWLMDDLHGNTNIVDYLDHTFVDWSDEFGFGRDMLIRMELLKDLRGIISKGRLFSEAEILKVGRDICTALELCHRKNILHRDIKPENIFVNKDGNFKLGDFGVSRILSAAPMAMASTSIGTLEYAAPEQFTGHHDKRVDIYSLGLVLYELGNRNRLPFSESSYVRQEDIRRRQIGEPLPAPSDVSSAFAQVILRACAYRAEDRYQSAEEFLDALDHISPEQKADIIEQDLNVTQRARPAPSEKNWQGSERSGFETVPADFGSNFVQNKVENSKTNSRPFLPTPPSRLLIKIVLGLTVLIMLVAGISAIYVLKTSGSKKENNNVLGSSETQDVGATINVLQSASTESNENMAELPEPPKADYRNGGTIAVGYDVSLGLREDGTLIALGENDFGQRNVSGWTDIVMVAAGFKHTVGLRSDGTAVATGFQKEGSIGNIADWRDLTAISAGSFHTVGLRADGTVVAAGWNGYGQCDVSAWRDIIEVSAGESHTVGLRSNGTVVAVGAVGYGECDVNSWNDIIAVSVGDDHTVGLKKDGTVVAVGRNVYGQCNVSDWRDIVAIFAGDEHTVGLKTDGTVVATGRNQHGECEVSGWTDIVEISAGNQATLGLRRDGTVVATGLNDCGQCNIDGFTLGSGINDCASLNGNTLVAGAYHSVLVNPNGTIRAVGRTDDGRCAVGSWKDIVSVSAANHTVGLKSDGTVVAVGPNEEDGRCDVGNWRDIVQVFAGYKNTIGVRKDGTAVIVGDNTFEQCDEVSTWSDIVSACVGETTAYGLRKDGTVVASSKHRLPGDEVASWSDIVQISSVFEHVVGLRSDGTVVAAGNNYNGECDVSSWRDIIAVSAGYGHTVGLKKDGTVVCTGLNKYGQCNTYNWTNIKWISAGMNHTLGMTEDGTIVAVGNNAFQQCNIAN